MTPYPQYVPIAPARAEPAALPRPTGRSPVASAGIWAFALAALLMLGLSGLVTYRWLDHNLLHWGVTDGKTTEVNSAQLLEKIRAFELGTIKHEYGGNAHVDASKVLNAGPASFSLPSWVAGQKLDVKGKVTVTAGVDLAKVRPEDIQVTHNGNATVVVVTLPSPEILSAELVPNTLDMDTSAGVLTRLKTAAGFSEKDLRDQAADQVIAVAKRSALENSILDDAARETERRLQPFLQSIALAGNEHTVITVISRPPANQ